MNDKFTLAVFFCLTLLLGALDKPAKEAPPLVSVKPADGLSDLKPIRSSESARVTRPPATETQKDSGDQQDRLKLLSGGSLTGKFIGFEDGRVQWSNTAFKAQVSVDQAAVDSIGVKQSVPPSRETDCRVTLVTGESLTGSLKSLNEKALIIETWFAGELSVPRGAVRLVEPALKAMPVVYEGPKQGPDGWMTGNRNTGVALKPFNVAEQQVQGAGPAQERALEVIGRRPIANAQAIGGKKTVLWRYANKGFISMLSGPILGRKDLTLPDRCSLEFDFQYLGYFNLGINIFADQIKNEYSGNSYSLRLDQNNAYLYRIQNGSTSNLGNAQSQLSGRTECRVTLLVDKPAKTIALLINDRLVNKWEDGRGAFAGKGNGVLFTSRNNSAMRISRIRIREWDGALPNGDNDVVGNGKEDYVRFTNGDGFSGKILRIEDAKLVFKTNFGEVPVPINTVEKMAVVNPVQEAGNAPGSVSTELVGGGSLVLEFLQWDKQMVKVRHKSMGDISMKPSVFESLKFNLDQPRQRQGTGLFDQ